MIFLYTGPVTESDVVKNVVVWSSCSINEHSCSVNNILERSPLKDGKEGKGVSLKRILRKQDRHCPFSEIWKRVRATNVAVEEQRVFHNRCVHL